MHNHTENHFNASHESSMTLCFIQRGEAPPVCIFTCRWRCSASVASGQVPARSRSSGSVSWHTSIAPWDWCVNLIEIKAVSHLMSDCTPRNKEYKKNFIFFRSLSDFHVHLIEYRMLLSDCLILNEKTHGRDFWHG